MASSAPPAKLALIVYKISKITDTNSFTLISIASSPFAFFTILTTDTVNKTTSDEIAIGATNPCTASQNTSRMVNKNLADLVQTLYKEQFNDISSADNTGMLSDLCSYSKDKIAVSKLDFSTYYSTENMLPNKEGVTEATSLPTTQQTTFCSEGDTLISNIRPYFKKILYCDKECGCSSDVLCFTPTQPRYAAYLFSTLYADNFFAFMIAGSKGTKMPRGDKQQIMTYPLVIPSNEELEKFNTIAFPALKQIHSNRAENKKLSALRDTLLPKLMSGELDVSDIDL